MKQVHEQMKISQILEVHRGGILSEKEKKRKERK